MNAPTPRAAIEPASEFDGLRAPPQSLEAERAVIGALLNDGAATVEACAGVLTAQAFYGRGHGMVWQAAVDLAAAGKPIDIVTLWERLRERGQHEQAGGLSHLNELAQGALAIGSARRHAEIVAERAARRAVIAAADALSAAAFRVDAPLPAALEAHASALAALEAGRMRKAPRTAAELMRDAAERYQARADGEESPAWPTGIRPLDAILGGGLRPGRVYGIAARPSVGKSSAARTWALSLARHGCRTLLLSMEMPTDEVADCIVSEVGGVNGEALRGVLERDDMHKVLDAMEEARTLPLWVDDDGGLTLGDIGAKVRQVKGLQVLVVDYLQLASSTLTKATTNDQVAEISKGLKRLALNMGIAVVVLSQLNRDVEKRVDKEPLLADLRDSGAIEQDLDVAVLLWTARESDDNPTRLVGWKVAKHRGGRKATFAMRFDPRTYAWWPSDEPLRAVAPKGGIQWKG